MRKGCDGEVEKNGENRGTVTTLSVQPTATATVVSIPSNSHLTRVVQCWTPRPFQFVKNLTLKGLKGKHIQHILLSMVILQSFLVTRLCAVTLCHTTMSHYYVTLLCHSIF